MTRIRRFSIVGTIVLLFSSLLSPIQGNSAINSSLTTCISLTTGIERISHTGKCRITQEAQANWHQLTVDSVLPDTKSNKQIVICSNKPTSPVSYEIIRPKCAKHQLRSEYFRSSLLTAAPVITKVEATGYNSAQISLATDPYANLDAPVAYYTITSSKGQSKNFYSWGELKLTIDNLSELTAYTFAVTATTADGTSKVSTSTATVITTKYVAPPTTSTAAPADPVAQVSLLSNDTASVTIPAGATNVAVSAPNLGNPSLSFGSQSSTVSATISSAVNPTGGASTPFTVSGSTKIVDISVTGLSGTATVCLDAIPTAHLWHFEGGVWKDITTSHTSTQVCGLTSSFSPFAGEEKLPQPAFTLSTNSRTGTRNSILTTVTATKNAHSQQVTYSVSPGLPAGLLLDTSTGTISGTPIVEALSTDYLITATNPASETATQTINLTIDPALGCGFGGECLLGSTGPAGGIIFYVSADGFNCGPAWSATGSPTGGLCHYLEVAPKGWSGSVPDPARPARVNAPTIDIAGIPNNHSIGGGHLTRDLDTADFDYLDTSQLGAGFLYSNLINAADTGATAARLARSYTTSGLSDFYLPTLTELNLLCQWSKGRTQIVDTKCGAGTNSSELGLGGAGSTSTFWSSSDKFTHSSGNFTAWVLVFDLVNSGYAPSSESFGDYAIGSWRVRPIRAF